VADKSPRKQAQPKKLSTKEKKAKKNAKLAAKEAARAAAVKPKSG